MNRSPFFALLVATSISGACTDTPDGASILVDVRTDLRPGTDFAAVDVSLPSEALSDSQPALGSEDWFAGQRVAELGPVAPGSKTVQVVMRDASGEVVLQRPVEVDVADTDVGVTVVLTRSCIDVTCPGATDPAGNVACLAGSCVPAACRAGALESCGAAQCIADIGCGLANGCTTPRCVGGACLSELDDSACAAGEQCVAGEGCVPIGDGGTLDGGMDGGVRDTGLPDAALCPTVPFTPYEGRPCSRALYECLVGCVDGACTQECLTGLGSNECTLCLNATLLECAVGAGCQEDWDCWAPCAMETCPDDIYDCLDTSRGCPQTEALVTCVNSTGSSGSCSFSLECFAD